MTARGPFGLYVHWPFCRSKCPYCDFNSHVADRPVDHAAWRAAYLREIDATATALAGRPLTSIFFGGGTPSLMAPDTVAAVIARAKALWPESWANGKAPEITLEANPTSAEGAKFAAFAEAGVNRLSLGIQSLEAADLSFLGREHSAGEALDALALAQRHFDRVSADLIYARPGQSVAAWGEELAPLLDRGLTHLSLYQLTIERGTPFFGLHRKGAFALPEEEDAARLYEATEDMLSAAGLLPYEISNYAVPGQECRHNLIYWQYRDYAGIGPGAHGRIPDGTGGTLATVNARKPDDWLSAVRDHGVGRSDAVLLTRDERIAEMVMMGLRLNDGIAEDDVRRVAGVGIEEALDPSRLARLVRGGVLECGAGRLRATAEGRLRLDALLGELLA